MPKRALAEKRPILLASLAASLAFFALRQSPVVPEMFLIPLKGAAVGLLALFAALAPSQKALAVAMLVLTPLLFWLLPAERSEALPTAIYGLVLGAMAACAWTSAFSRYRVGIGAVLFLVSDVLIVAGGGPLMGYNWPQWLIWPLYYLGQLLICLGIVQRLGRPGLAPSRPV